MRRGGRAGGAGRIFGTALGELARGDAAEWLAGLSAGSARLVVADPPYNIGKARWDSFPTLAAYLDWTESWVGAAKRCLTDDGTIYLCGFPEILAHVAARVAPLFRSQRHLVWFYRNKANLADDWGRSHEGILHLRASRRMVFNTDAVRIPYNHHTTHYPRRTQAETSQYGGARSAGRAAWTPHPLGARARDVLEIPTLCNGSREKTLHPTQKPEELIRRLVLASSNRGDLVVDPFGGSGTTYVVCEQTGRRWLGCEKDPGYCRVIARRLATPGRFRARQFLESTADRARRRERLRGPS